MLRDKVGHALFCCLDALEQFELHPCAVKIVERVLDLEISVALEIIGQETDAELKGDDLYRQRQ